MKLFANGITNIDLAKLLSIETLCGVAAGLFEASPRIGVFVVYAAVLVSLL